MVDCELPAPQVAQDSRVRGEGEGQLVGVQRLPGLAVLPVHASVPILSVPQQGTADLRHGDPDLVGASGEEAAFHQ